LERADGDIASVAGVYDAGRGVVCPPACARSIQDLTAAVIPTCSAVGIECPTTIWGGELFVDGPVAVVVLKVTQLDGWRGADAGPALRSAAHLDTGAAADSLHLVFARLTACKSIIDSPVTVIVGPVTDLVERCAGATAHPAFLCVTGLRAKADPVLVCV